MNTPNTSDRILNDLIFVENIHNEDLFDQGQKAEFIKTLEAEIGKRWHDRVNNIKSMFVLFVGQDTKLLQALGSYYYLTRGKTCLSFYSLGGKTDDELKGMFSQVEAFRTGNNKITDGNLLERLRQGCSVFLDCLRCKDGLFLEWLVSEIRDVERQYHYNKGMLIISTLTPLTDIPEYFKELFEVIELEPGKQSKVNGIKKPNSLFYSWNEKDKLMLYSKKGKRVELTEQESKLILCLKEDRKTQDEIIEHIWEVYKSFDIKKKKPNLGEIRRRVNAKCWEIAATDLISELTDGYYNLGVDIEER